MTYNKKKYRVVAVFVGVLFFLNQICLGDQSGQVDVGRIRTLAQSSDYKRLVELVDVMGADWIDHPDTGYLDFLLNLNKEVAAYGAPSEERNNFILSVAENALEKEPPNGIKKSALLRKQAYFLFLVMKESVFVETPNLREKRCQIVVTFLARINDTRDPNYVHELISKPIFIFNGLPAGEIPVGSHVRPEMIKNEELRADYEKRIREYEEEVEQNQMILRSNMVYRLLHRDVKKFFTHVFKDEPDGIDLIRQWMELGKFSASDIEEVIGAFPQKK